MKWADEFRKLRVRTNAETEVDSKTAREFGAEGIGLCRTEHMFFDEERILSVRQMILSRSIEDRNHALLKLLPHQNCLLYTSPSPRDRTRSRMPSSA